MPWKYMTERAQTLVSLRVLSGRMWAVGSKTAHRAGWLGGLSGPKSQSGHLLVPVIEPGCVVRTAGGSSLSTEGAVTWLWVQWIRQDCLVSCFPNCVMLVVETQRANLSKQIGKRTRSTARDTTPHTHTQYRGMTHRLRFRRFGDHVYVKYISFRNL
jgi:hypothetical protein